METVIDEINNAFRTLNLSEDSLVLLPPAENEKVYQAALNHFVSSGDRRWWWEDFREKGIYADFEDGSGWNRILEIVPDPDEQVWFIAEEDQLPYFPVYQTTPRIASKILAECYYFEYYLISKSYDWLVCETHHNRMIAIGNLVEKRLLSCSS